MTYYCHSENWSLPHSLGIFLLNMIARMKVFYIDRFIILQSFFFFLVVDIFSILISKSCFEILVHSYSSLGQFLWFIGSACLVHVWCLWKRFLLAFRNLWFSMVDLPLPEAVGVVASFLCLREENCCYCSKGSTHSINTLYLQTQLQRVWDFA